MMLSPELADRLRWRIEGYRNAMVDFQRDLTAVNAVGPDGGGEGEWHRAAFLKEELLRLGLGRAHEYNALDNRVYTGQRPNLVVRLEGRECPPTVWVMAHMDTVPPGDFDLWDTPPFDVVEREGRLYGRGVEDNQQGLTSAVFAARAVLEEGLLPTSDVGLLFVSDEESGNRFGLEHVLREAPDLVSPSDLVLVPDFGSAEGLELEVAEKSILQVEFTVKGKQAHASMPELAVNAHRAAAQLTVRLDLRLHARFTRTDPVFLPPESTFEPTRRDSNVPNINTIPGTDRFCFDCRVLPGEDIAGVQGQIEETAVQVEQEFGVEVSIAYPGLLPAAPPTAANAPVVPALIDAVKAIRGGEPRLVGIGGGTVAAVFRRRGIPAVAWSTSDQTAHQPNEYCVVDNLVSDALVMAHLFLRGQ
ncbi:MAG: M20 family metallo-hydrolase [Gaiellales bacterium]|nr:M20 family metallo-hydrolase [Gaiellales bacterium]